MTILVGEEFYNRSVDELREFIKRTDKEIEESESDLSVEQRKEIRDTMLNGPLLYMD